MMGSGRGPLRLLLLLVLLLAAPGAATEELVGPYVRVLYDDPALADYARRVAVRAEEALARVAALFGVEPPQVTLVVETDTDLFNAFAHPLPRSGVRLRALFPLDGAVGFRADDPLELLLLHELTHSVQLGYLELPGGEVPLPPLGLVGENVAAQPPVWVVEGLATWVESALTNGGRRDDPRTRGLLEALAHEGDWPELASVNLDTYRDWPAGEARYLLGVGFVDRLVRDYGFDALLETLRRLNAGSFLLPFAEAWRQATGSDLDAEWLSWRDELRAAAAARAEGLSPARKLTESGWYTGGPVVSPGGGRVAWPAWPWGVAVADLSRTAGSEEPLEVDLYLTDRRITDLAWLDDDTLLYSRLLRRARSTFSELFVFDLAGGRERQLTEGGRARFPQALPGGCVLYVRDVVPEGASLQRICPGGASERFWSAPAGQHLVGLAVSPAGRVAVALWRDGMADLALLEGEELRLLTDDPAQDLDPVWFDEDTLLFASDREGPVFEIFALGLAERTLRRVTRTLGGAFHPAAGGSEVLFRLQGAGGYDVASAPVAPAEGSTVLALPPPSPAAATGVPEAPAEESFPVRPYQPWPSLLPYGWMPSDADLSLAPFGAAIAATLYAEDDLADHGYALTVGYDSRLGGHLGGAHASLRYAYRDPGFLGGPQGPRPLSASLQVGVWPHEPHLAPRSETALGVRAGLTLTAPVDVELLGVLPLHGWVARAAAQAGAVHLGSASAWQFDGRVEAALSRQFADPFGYRSSGPRFGVTGVWSATAGGPSRGLWGDASFFQPLDALGLPGTAEVALRAGYRPASPVPLDLSDLAAIATVGYRLSLPLGWRIGDGLYALERVTLEPRTRFWYDGLPGLGADLSVSLDAVLLYGAPVSVGVALGYAQAPWFQLLLRLPL